MKKILASIIITLLIAFLPAPAKADDAVLVSGEFIDVDGLAVANLSYRFNFSNGTNASGSSDANGKFVVSGNAGNYTFSIYSRMSPCIRTELKGTFVSGRDDFKLVFPRRVNYTLNSFDVSGQPTHNTRWTLNYAIFRTPSNPKFGNPVFNCTWVSSRSNSSYAGTGAKLETFELDIDAMKVQASETGYARSSAEVVYADSVAGASSIQVPLDSLAANSIKVTAEKLPSLKLASVTFDSKTKKFNVKVSVSEADFYKGITIPRSVRIIWRWKSPSKNAKWVSWRVQRPLVQEPDGSFSDSFTTKFTPAEKRGALIEVKAVGATFGSMSPVYTFKVK